LPGPVPPLEAVPISSTSSRFISGDLTFTKCCLLHLDTVVYLLVISTVSLRSLNIVSLELLELAELLELLELDLLEELDLELLDLLEELDDRLEELLDLLELDLLEELLLLELLDLLEELLDRELLDLLDELEDLELLLLLELDLLLLLLELLLFPNGYKATAKACFVVAVALIVASIFPVDPEAATIIEQISRAKSELAFPASSSSTHATAPIFAGLVKVLIAAVAYTAPKYIRGELAKLTVIAAARSVALLVLY
jgi:hypothetical protein